MNQAEVISMRYPIHGEPHDQNILEKSASRLMGGDQQPQIVIDQEYGRTPYSDEPLKLYESTRNKRTTLDAGEYYAISQGYLRECATIIVPIAGTWPPLRGGKIQFLEAQPFISH
jgi:hypothetical protein